MKKIDQIRALFPEAIQGEDILWEKIFHACGVPFCLHWPQRDRNCPSWKDPLEWTDEKHRLIAGDNLDVLRRLERYQNKIKMIYIDPPYNTGKSFAYDDKRHDKNVDPQSQQHSAWLNMMEPRLRMAHQLLHPKGAIFISIDNHELAVLRLLCDDIFGVNNFVQCFVWLHGKGKKDKHSRTQQQYILCYAKDRTQLPTWRVVVRKEYDAVSNPDGDHRGPWFSGSMSFSEQRSNPKHPNYFAVTSPTGVVWKRQWFFSKEEYTSLQEDNLIYFGTKPKQNRVPRHKIFPMDDEIIPPSVLQNCGTTREAQKELNVFFGGKSVFPYPKPVALLKHLILMASKEGDIILDFFAGSGTTLHAALALEDEGKGKRMTLCIQSKEPTPPSSVAHQHHFFDVFSIAKHRIISVLGTDYDTRVSIHEESEQEDTNHVP